MDGSTRRFLYTSITEHGKQHSTAYRRVFPRRHMKIISNHACVADGADIGRFKSSKINDLEAVRLTLTSENRDIDYVRQSLRYVTRRKNKRGSGV